MNSPNQYANWLGRVALLPVLLLFTGCVVERGEYFGYDVQSIRAYLDSRLEVGDPAEKVLALFAQQDPEREWSYSEYSNPPYYKYLIVSPKAQRKFSIKVTVDQETQTVREVEVWESQTFL